MSLLSPNLFKPFIKYISIATFTVIFVSACSGEDDENSDDNENGGVVQTPVPEAPEPSGTPTPTLQPEPEPTPTSTPTPTPDAPQTASCEISIGSLPEKSGCNGILLTDQNAIASMTEGVSITVSDEGHDIIHVGYEESLTLKNEGCYQFGQKDDSFSVSFWLKTGEDWQSDSAHIIGNRQPWTIDRGFFVHARTNNDGTLRMSMNSRTGSAADGGMGVESTSFNVGEWAHVVFSYESKNEVGEFTIYVNNQSTKGVAHFDIFRDDKDLIIGDTGTSGESSQFNISEMTFYDTKLSAQEVGILYAEDAKSPISSDTLTNAIDTLNKHINGEVSLSATDIAQLTDDFADNQSLIVSDEDIIRSTLALIENFESTHGALFTTPSTRSGFLRINETDGLDLERSMFRIQQTVHDTVFTNAVLNISACRTLLEGKKFDSSDYFPGAVPPPEDPNLSYDVNVDATVNKHWGMDIAFDDEPSRRPTGKYLAPGSVAKVTVPQSMVNAGFSVLVGAHTFDHGTKGNLRRFDSVYREFPIEATEVYIANPLGGGIYINAPYLSNLSIQKIQLQNVLQAPFYSTKSENKTTLTQWNEYRASAAPWADFETDNFMMQVPTNWIYAMENPQSLMEGWTAVMDGMTELKGMTPDQRNRKVLYVQVDARSMHDGFNGIGYPQANITYNPDADEQGRSNHGMVTRPGTDSTMIHELTHAEAIFGFGGSEVEAIANFPAVYILTEKFGWSLEDAIKTGTDQDGDQAAINWMVTPNFGNGLEMDRSGNFSDETRYQRRGFMKYVDIGTLFGWDTVKAFYKEINENAEAGIGDGVAGLSQADSIMLKYSEKANADLRPLFHFWGRHPENNGALSAAMNERGLEVSNLVTEKLRHYADIAPKNNDEFQVHHNLIYRGQPLGTGDYGQEMYTELSQNYDESNKAQIESVIESIINMYL